ncbi:hypothetical protein J2S78_002055 [Salibacterium salarium]|uniref:hypothetical protein n=1 Tax=Salibacterium salarium TaxID=284579 RepID=UPI00278501B4|nr:hypothetical protein [Salibacterium salarium]MDQ0299635.1 hypothetical protein [Salibacterium salarium]
MPRIRDLSIGITWDINDRAMRDANDQTDRFVDKVSNIERDIQNMGRQFDRTGSDMDRTLNQSGSAVDRFGERIDSASTGARNAMDRVSSSIVDVRGNILSIPDPNINAGQPVRQLQDINDTAEGTQSTIRGMPDPEINGSQAKKELEDVEKEALNLKDVLSGIGGFGAGSVVGGDIASFQQMPRDFMASLNLDDEVANRLTEETKDVWESIPNIHREEAQNAVEQSYRRFGSGQYGGDIANLADVRNADVDEVGKATSLMTDRFDVSPEESLDLFSEAATKLSDNAFEELTDQFSEFSGGMAEIGLDADQAIAPMIQAGEIDHRVMDRFSDSINSEFLPSIRSGEDDVMESLSELGGSRKQAEQWANNIREGGEKGSSAFADINEAISEIEDTQKKSSIFGSIYGEMSEEQESSILPIVEAIDTSYQDMSSTIEDVEQKNEGMWNSFIEKTREARTTLDEATEGTFGPFAEVIGNTLPTLGAIGGYSLGKRSTGGFGRGGKGGSSGQPGKTGKGGGLGKGIMNGVRGAAKWGGRALAPVGIGMDVYDIATSSPGEDREEAVGSAAGGWSGAAAGATGGAALGSVVPGVGSAIGGAVGGIGGYFGGSKLGEFITDKVDFSAIPDKVGEAKDQAVDFLSDLPSDAATEAGKIAGSVASELVAFPGEFGDWFESAYDNAIDWMKGLPEDIGNFVANIPSRVSEGIGAIKSSFSNLGSSAIDGIVSGFNSAKEGLGKAGNWIVDRVSGGVDFVQNRAEDFTGGFNETFEMPGHAEGGIFDQPHIASFAENGREAAIPIDENRERALGIWQETGRLLGVGQGSTSQSSSTPATKSSSNYNFSPVINITVTGNMSENQERDVERNWKRKMKKWHEEFHREITAREV